MLIPRHAAIAALLLSAMVSVAAPISPAFALSLHPRLEGQNFEIDLEAFHGWCTGGQCSFSSGDYHLATLEAYTFAPMHVNRRVTTPDEALLRCEHTYTDGQGVRHEDIAQAHAFVNDNGLPVHGSIAGTVGVPLPNSGRTSTFALGLANITVQDSGLVFGYDGQLHMVSAVGTATGLQTTDNTYRKGTLAGGMQITITGTVLRYHEISGTYGPTWVFDGAPNAVTTCPTTNVPPGFEYDGNSIYDRGDH